jgi:predicted metal-dependent hydrolase
MQETGIRHVVMYGSKQIEYSLIHAERKTLEIAVYPDATVLVKAPVQSDVASIEQKVLKRARWILAQINYFKQFNPKTPERCYVNGETHLYLGKQYRLKLVTGLEKSVKLVGGYFVVTYVDSPLPVVIEKMLDAWYAEKATLQFQASIDRCWQKFGEPGVEKPVLTIRSMQKRWGSLSANGMIVLNRNLVRAPRECIDYVVTHELCHVFYNDHGPAFYKLLDAKMPGWKALKHKLELALI